MSGRSGRKGVAGGRKKEVQGWEKEGDRKEERGKWGPRRRETEGGRGCRRRGRWMGDWESKRPCNGECNVAPLFVAV